MKTLVALVLALLSAEAVVAQDVSPAGLAAYAAADWKDPSPHRQTLITVADSVRLEVLDWGGRGPGLVFLPGTSMSAHLFDDLAPAFRNRFRVVGITPRGQGRSDTPVSGYTVAQEAADLSSVLDSLGIGQAILVGWSLGGSVITAFAHEHPDRVRALVYLDATMDYAGMDSLDAKNPVKRPTPEGGWKTNPEEWRAQYRGWLARYFFGTWTNALEADFRAGQEALAANATRRQEFTKALVNDASAHPKMYTGLRAPALALWGQKTAANLFPWLASARGEERTKADAFVRDVRMAWEREGGRRFQKDYAGAQLLPIDGAHYFYITDQDATAAALNEFCARIARSDSRQ